MKYSKLSFIKKKKKKKQDKIIINFFEFYFLLCINNVFDITIYSSILFL